MRPSGGRFPASSHDPTRLAVGAHDEAGEVAVGIAVGLHALRATQHHQTSDKRTQPCGGILCAETSDAQWTVCMRAGTGGVLSATSPSMPGSRSVP